MATMIAATRQGLHTFDPEGVPGQVHHEGRSVTALGRAGSDYWAIVEASELWHAAGDSWSHVTDLAGPRATCIADVHRHVLVGTSEARLFQLAADALVPVHAFDRATGRSTWYTPWGGPPDVRSIANWDDDVYVNVHVGGILRSDDGGESWTPTIDIDADVHQVTTAEGMVLAATAGGLAVSFDGGTRWAYRTDGLEAEYSRAVAVCGDAVLMTASNGPSGGRAGIYRAPLARGAFVRCRGGLPDWFDGNIDTYCLDALPTGSLAAFGTADGRVFVSSDQGSTWEERVSGLRPISRVLVMP